MAPLIGSPPVHGHPRAGRKCCNLRGGVIGRRQLAYPGAAVLDAGNSVCFAQTTALQLCCCCCAAAPLLLRCCCAAAALHLLLRCSRCAVAVDVCACFPLQLADVCYYCLLGRSPTADVGATNKGGHPKCG